MGVLWLSEPATDFSAAGLAADWDGALGTGLLGLGAGLLGLGAGLLAAGAGLLGLGAGAPGAVGTFAGGGTFFSFSVVFSVRLATGGGALGRGGTEPLSLEGGGAGITVRPSRAGGFRGPPATGTGDFGGGSVGAKASSDFTGSGGADDGAPGSGGGTLRRVGNGGGPLGRALRAPAGGFWISGSVASSTSSSWISWVGSSRSLPIRAPPYPRRAAVGTVVTTAKGLLGCATMGVRLSEHRFATDAGERTALLITPTTHVRVGRERLQQLREAHPGSAIDREIIEALRSHDHEDALVVFRGRDPDGQGSWGFAEDLSDEEAMELGYHLVLDQLPCYQRLVRAGVFALIHVEWGARETNAYRQGTERALEELDDEAVPEVTSDTATIERLRADRYILRNLTHFHDQPLDAVVRSVLVAHHASFEAQIPHFRALLGHLPTTDPPAAA